MSKYVQNILLVMVIVSSSLQAEVLYNLKSKKCIKTPTYYLGIQATNEEMRKYPQCTHTTVLDIAYPNAGDQTLAYAANHKTYPRWMWFNSHVWECGDGKTFYFFMNYGQCHKFQALLKKAKK